MPTVFQSPPESETSPKKKQFHQTPLSPFATFAVAPDGIRFETQKQDEEVILFLRQHYIVNISWVVLSILFFIAPPFIFPFIMSITPFSIQIPAQYIFIGTLFWYLATFGYVLANFVGWFFNIYIVTNQRVIDVDFYYLLYKHIAEAQLTKIQDLAYATGGISATIFNYGYVRIQTAGNDPNIEFERVPKPAIVVSTIRELISGITS